VESCVRKGIADLLAGRDDILRLSLPQPKRKSSLPPPPIAKRRRTSPPQSTRPAPTGEAIVLDLDSDDDDIIPITDHPSAQPDSRPRSDPSTNLISCPACAQQLPLTALNTHLDRGCPPVRHINGNGSTSTKAWAALFSTAAAGPSRTDADAELLSKRITKPNYALAPTKELRGLLETYGCPVAGERAVLIERVQLWISIFKYVPPTHLSPFLARPGPERVYPS
jgi:E3 ubiquitin-protein ligase RAD18